MASNNVELVPPLQMSGGLKSTDPRDRIFALVGLSSERNTAIIDYGVDINHILRKIFVDYICSCDPPKALDILSIVCRSDVGHAVPTWVATYDGDTSWFTLLLIYKLLRPLTKVPEFSFGSRGVSCPSGS